MSQFSLFDTEPIKQSILPIETEIRYKNGSHIIKGKILDSRHDGKYVEYQVRSDKDIAGGEYYGYSIQWINDFQIK